MLSLFSNIKYQISHYIQNITSHVQMPQWYCLSSRTNQTVYPFTHSSFIFTISSYLLRYFNSVWSSCFLCIFYWTLEFSAHSYQELRISTQFKTLLKTHLFTIAFQWRSLFIDASFVLCFMCNSAQGFWCKTLCK